MKFSIALSLFFSVLFLQSNYSYGQEKIAPNRHLYFQHDNDVFRLVEKSDKYYSFGLLMGFHHTLSANSKLKNAFFFLPKRVQEKGLFTLDYALKGYTPEFENDTISGPKRPFAGVSVFQTGIQSSSLTRMFSFRITLGFRGPASGAEAVQDNFHRWIGDEVFEGWAGQLPNKFLYGVKSTFAKSLPITKWADVSSITEVALGNYQTHLDQRIRLRMGNIRPLGQSLMFSNHLGELFENPEFYLSATLIGRLVGVDTTFGKLDGQARTSDDPNKSNALAGYEVAAHFQSNRLGLFVAHNRISSESNFSTKHSYGSLGISYSF